MTTSGANMVPASTDLGRDMTDTTRIIVETEGGRTVPGASVEQLQQLIEELAEPDNMHLTVSTGVSGLEVWHILVSLDHEKDGWYQVQLQDFLSRTVQSRCSGVMVTGWERRLVRVAATLGAEPSRWRQMTSKAWSVCRYGSGLLVTTSPRTARASYIACPMAMSPSSPASRAECSSRGATVTASG